MIVVACIAIGLALRLATGRPLGGLADARLRLESLLLLLLVAQLAAPSLHLTGESTRIAYIVWLATFPCMVGIAWLNRRHPGMVALGLGLLLNFSVVAANGGMPVFGAAAAAVRGSAATIVVPAGDFVHVVGGAMSRLPWLADVLPLPGPVWLRVLASPGDVLLLVGVITFVANAGAGRMGLGAVPKSRVLLERVE